MTQWYGIHLPYRTLEDSGLIPGLSRSPGERNGNPLLYSCLGNPMDGVPVGLQSMGLQKSGHDLMTVAWWATVHRFARSRTRLSNYTFIFTSNKDPEGLYCIK